MADPLTRKGNLVTIFIGGLAPTTTQAQVVAAISQFCQVFEINIPLRRNLKKCRGYAFVKIADLKGAESILRADVIINGRRVDCQIAFDGPEHGPYQTTFEPKKVVLTGLPYNLETEGLMTLLSAYKSLRGCYMLVPTPQTKNAAVVEFNDETDAHMLQNSKLHIDGHRIHVNHYSGELPQPYKISRLTVPGSRIPVLKPEYSHVGHNNLLQKHNLNPPVLEEIRTSKIKTTPVPCEDNQHPGSNHIFRVRTSGRDISDFTKITCSGSQVFIINRTISGVRNIGSRTILKPTMKQKALDRGFSFLDTSSPKNSQLRLSNLLTRNLMYHHDQVSWDKKEKFRPINYSSIKFDPEMQATMQDFSDLQRKLFIADH